MITWIWRSYDELTKAELYDILSIRQEVFLIEQKCFYVDLDYYDQQAMHLLGMCDNKLAAYLRYFPVGTYDNHTQLFGRVLTASHARGKGVGKEMVHEVLRYADPSQPITISAQLYLEKFYQTFGFKTISEPYDDADILHINMRLDAKE